MCSQAKTPNYRAALDAGGRSIFILGIMAGQFTASVEPFSRCMRNATIVFMILFSACQASVAAPRVFQSTTRHRTPLNWQTLDPPPTQRSQSPNLDGLKTIMVIAGKLPATELSTASRDMSAEPSKAQS